jgi:glycosyltransferase involved in cell wall biosynthesis
LLQALALGKPVAATRAGGIPEVIVPGETGLLSPPRDSRALAENMSHLARDASWREKLGQQGPQLVASRYSLDRMAEALEALYGEIMTISPVPSPASRISSSQRTS